MSMSVEQLPSHKLTTFSELLVFGLSKKNQCWVGTRFYASVVDWILRYGHCTQKWTSLQTVVADRRNIRRSRNTWMNCS